MQKFDRWFAYKLPPIDGNWPFLKRVDEVIGQFIQAFETEDAPWFALQSLLDDLNYSRYVARMAGWEGDYRQSAPHYGDVHIFWIPDDECFKYGFVWKQENNGDTLIVSPKLLPWLRDVQVKYFGEKDADEYFATMSVKSNK